jgi:hypothetical protein
VTAEQVSEEFDRLQVEVPGEFLDPIRALPRLSDPQLYFKTQWEFCERLTKYLCELVNAVYLDVGTRDPVLEKKLRTMSKNATATFGDHRDLLQSLINWIKEQTDLGSSAGALRAALIADVPPQERRYSPEVRGAEGSEDPLPYPTGASTADQLRRRRDSVVQW